MAWRIAMKKTLFTAISLSVLVANISYGAAIDVKIQKAAAADRHFEALKAHIQQTCLSNPAWRSLNSQQIVAATDCASSAYAVVQFFTGGTGHFEKDINKLEKEILARQAKQQADGEYYGTYTNFVDKNGTNYKLLLAQQLLCRSYKPCHTLFLVACGGAQNHYCCIEKQSDGNDTRWRIYQSCYQEYTLAEWLGVDTWRYSLAAAATSTGLNALKIEYLDRTKNFFGSGKLLFCTQLRECFDIEFGDAELLHVKAFEIDDKELDKHL
jgi:hypothetical protein